MNSIRRKLIGLFPKIAGSYITISTPHNGAQILIGETLAITGITDFADGSTVSIYAGATLIGTATVSDGGFSYMWTVDGEAGNLTVKASCGGIEDTVTVTLVAAMTIVSPVANQSVLPDTAFPVDIETAQEGNVLIYAGSTLIATIPIVSGEADGTAVIPSEILGVGSVFIIEEGEEIPVGNVTTVTLTFTDGVTTKNVNVLATLSSEFIVGTAEGSMGFTADHTVTGEFTFDAAGQIGYTPEEEKTAEFVLEAEGSVSVTDS